MKKILMAAALMTVLGSSVAIALTLAEQRDQTMEGVGKATKPVGGMLKGQVPFDLATVKTALTTYAAATKLMPTLYGEDVKEAAKSKSLPIIWEKKAEFDALWVKFNKDSETAMAAITDEATFKSEMPKVLGNCGGCHKTFKKSDK